MLIPGLHKGYPSYRRSLQPSKKKIQHFKTRNFFTFFCFCESVLHSWIRIRIQQLKLMRIEIWIWIQNLALKKTFKFRHCYGG
jgi:hypothetical protein